MGLPHPHYYSFHRAQQHTCDKKPDGTNKHNVMCEYKVTQTLRGTRRVPSISHMKKKTGGYSRQRAIETRISKLCMGVGLMKGIGL